MGDEADVHADIGVSPLAHPAGNILGPHQSEKPYVLQHMSMQQHYLMENISDALMAALLQILR